MKTLAAAILLSIGFLIDANLTNDHLKVFKGDWEGNLTYLNYGDDKTLVTLPVKLVATYSEKGLSFEYFYTEPGGAIEKRKGKFELRGEKVYYNGRWDLVSTEIDDMENWTMELKSTGKDNNRKADFQKTIVVSTSKITVTKKVKYEGTDEFFMRNQHIFKR
ncbi:MAG: hypothetical protein HEP71_15610 [Roseivirga sp.]|nr:hypothetical protein [Roseivirga sp.]